MKSSHIARRSKRFEVTTKARKVASLEAMVIDFEFMALELARQIFAEEQRTGIRDAAHIAYSTLAKATALRRTKLLDSTADLRAKLDMARREHEEAKAQLRALEPTETRGVDRQLREVDGTIAHARPN